MEAVGYREAPGEQTRVEELKNRQPGLRFVSLLDYQLPKTMWEMDGAEEEKNDLICIGVDLAYVLHARYVADLFLIRETMVFMDWRSCWTGCWRHPGRKQIFMR